uniref:Ribose-5-phosphate isomerase n=1 Tax=Ananas comosus var. bracteatus TaxID=296719 RepID=A0A6V7NLW0_ANACO|nr:unnamed protein product [Ananas comosus var. bracteatus]
MASYASSDSDRDDALDEDMEALRRACMLTGADPPTPSAAPTPTPGARAATPTTSASSAASRSGSRCPPPRRGLGVAPLVKPLSILPQSDSDEEDDFETLRAIQRRFFTMKWLPAKRLRGTFVPEEGSSCQGTLTALIGRRKPEVRESLLIEKSIAKAASKLALIVAEKQYTRDVDGSIPVLVNCGNWMETAEEIDDLFLEMPRPTSGQADPMGGDFPLVTKEGHHILDVIFTSPILDLGQVAESLDQIAGVVDHGIIFSVNPCVAIIASKNGVAIVDKKSSVIS